MAEVVLERVGKTYPNGVRAVHDLSLTIADGELIVLVGPSGCGKTTTLRLIAGLETPTGGTIRIGGRVVNGEPPHRRDVAMVFQRPALYPHLNVRGNLGFGLALRRGGGRTAAERRERVERTARLLELTDLLDRRPQRVVRRAAAAGGARPRPGARAGRFPARRAAQQPRRAPPNGNAARVALAPSPSAGDNGVCHPRSGRGADARRPRGAAGPGRVQQADRPQALYDRPANRSAAAFIGWPPMNFLEGRLVEEDGRLVSGRRRGDVVPGRAAGRMAGLRRPRGGAGRPAGTCAGDGASGSTLMEVRLVERAGPFRLATLRVRRLDGDGPAGRAGSAVSEGDGVGVEFALVQAHLFDRATGRLLSSGRSNG